ncbi:hypothetical protein [Bacillus sp. Au-Bac7]|uniref:hypothetical protein n=1 Tax=Bacillus sp. Au-Bac7 TaxID=2906458 RepID=UPI001E5E4BAF|nr:hypothetical protein [Bacillus sp. Au-Bac7]MCE4051689.1 hypothetical protein [Bacillus sp. Au-Bac7]
MENTAKAPKEPFFLKFLEPDLESMLKEMRYGPEVLIRFQKKRVYMGIGYIVFGLCLSVFSPFLILFGLLLAVMNWMNAYKRVKRMYNNASFLKQFAFSKFSRTLLPYLLQSNATLYSVFNGMLAANRIENEHLKGCLERLIIEMNDHPESEEPFKRFAREASGTDNAELFMTTLYDFSQHTFDSSILVELGKMATDDLFNGINQVTQFKLRKFDMNPTKLTMINLVLIAGYMASSGLHLILELFHSL